MREFRAALIGAGNIAQNHLNAIRDSDRTELVGIADLDQLRVTELAHMYGTEPYVDYKHMVETVRPDIVVIALPHYLHKEAAIWCMEQGCHVLLEKPMAMNVQECEEMNTAAATYKKVVAVGHMQHYFPTIMKAKQIIESGELGQLIMIHDRRHGHYFRPDRPKWFVDKALSGGGIVMNLGSHSIDKIQWLSGSTIHRVKASMTYYAAGVDVEGSGCLFMQTLSGIAATVSLIGYRGSVQLDETELLFTEGQMKINGTKQLWVSRDRAYVLVETGGFPNPFAAQWNDMLDHVETGPESGISGAYGRSVIAVIEAAYRSHETGIEQRVQYLAD